MNEEQDKLHKKEYLGDGAYVQIGSYMGEVLLTAEDGVRVLQRVALDEQCTLNLLQWLTDRGWLITLGRRKRLTPEEQEPHDLADGPVEIPPGETRTFVIRPVDPDDPEGEQHQVER